MSDEPDRFFDQQDSTAKAVFVEQKGDELADILVNALMEAARLLRQDDRVTTYH